MADLFLDVLFDHARRDRYLPHEFVLMPNHLHLLITPAPVIALERCMQFIKGGFSFRANKELQFAGEVWERSFTNHRTRDAHDYAKHREYIHMNPVRAGLVVSAPEYPYSSANPIFVMASVPPGLKPTLFGAAGSHG
jgi:putative transposase